MSVPLQLKHFIWLKVQSKQEKNLNQAESLKESWCTFCVILGPAYAGFEFIIFGVGGIYIETKAKRHLAALKGNFLSIRRWNKEFL